MNTTFAKLLATLAALPLAASGPVLAQDAPASGYQLPPAPSTPSPRLPGPVDSDAPVVAPTPVPSPIPTPTPQPIPTPAPPPPAELVEERPAPVPRAAQRRPERPAAAAPTLSPEAAPVAAPVPVPTTASDAAPAPPSPPSTAPAAPSAADEPSSWPWAAGGGLVALMLAAAFAWRRRRALDAAGAEFEPDEPDEPTQAPPAPDPRPTPELPDTPAPLPSVLPQPAFAHPLTLSLEPGRMSASLLNATLQYRLEITNGGSEPLGQLVVCGDMIAAHASLDAAEQLGADGAALPERHRLAALAPGETAVLAGELRLPLSAITPIRQGRAALFVPLVRLRATGADALGPALGAAAFVVGEPAETPGGRLRPFRLDRGPRIYGSVEAHRLAMPPAMPLDARAKAG